MNKKMPLITVCNLEKRYLNKTIFSSLNFSVNEQDIFAISGDSGIGKTSLLNILSTLNNNFSGTVIIDSHDIKKLKGTALANFRNRTIGIIFQSNNLLPEFTAFENIIIPALINKKNTNYNVLAKELIDRVGLQSCRDKYPDQLSGGEAQRVAICRALINTPKVVFADEPTGSLDTNSETNILSLIKELALEYSITFVISSHSQAVLNAATQIFNLNMNAYLLHHY